MNMLIMQAKYYRSAEWKYSDVRVIYDELRGGVIG